MWLLLYGVIFLWIADGLELGRQFRIPGTDREVLSSRPQAKVFLSILEV